MKLTRNHIIILGIAFVLIALGLGQAITGYEINKKVMDQVSFILLMAAAFLLFNGRKKRAEQEKEKDTAEQIKEENAQEETVHNQIEEGDTELKNENQEPSKD